MSSAPPPDRLRLLLFALPWLPMAFIMMPIGMFIPAFYAAHTAATLAQLGIATGATRVLDAFVDPVIGHLSDRTRSRWGPRKPWVACGAVLFSTCVWWLFRPPADAGVGYYTLCSIGLYMSYACVEIPMRAWAAEWTAEALRRARVYTAIGLMFATGSLLFWLAPPAAQQFIGLADLNSPAGMALVSAAFCAAYPLLVSLTLWQVPQARPAAQAPQSMRALAHSVRHNRPFWFYLMSLSVWSLGNSAFASLVFIFLSDTLKLGAHVAPMMITYFVIQLAVMPMWVKALRWIDKHRLLALCWTLDAGLKCTLVTFEPGEVGVVTLYALITASAILGSISYTFPQALLADVVDYDALRTGVAKAASHFALNTLLYKTMMGLGAGMSLSLLGLFGYQVGQAHDDTARWGMNLAFAFLPATCLLIGAACLWRFPLDGRRQRLISRRLAQRRQRDDARAAARSAG